MCLPFVDVEGPAWEVGGRKGEESGVTAMFCGSPWCLEDCFPGVLGCGCCSSVGESLEATS